MTVSSRSGALSPDLPVIVETYGGSREHRAGRVALIGAGLDRFAREFPGDVPRVFRAPGRINLRGMHVDTHGGYINTMTLGRETVLVAAATDEPFVCLHNTAPDAGTVAFDIGGPRVADEGWGRYVLGCVRAVDDRFPGRGLRGLRGVVASDVPIGAGVSSSASLCAAVTIALLHLNHLKLPAGELVESLQAAEWNAGGRCGLGDPAAIVYGERNTVTRMAFDTGHGEPVQLDHAEFPDTHEILVVDSGTRREIAGADRVPYSANRAAYSCAIEVLRGELLKGGRFHDDIRAVRHFRDLKQSRIEWLADGCSVYTTLLGVPKRMKLADLEKRIGTEKFSQAFDEQLGDVDRTLWPSECDLRGPLLFGLAESERAELFTNLVALGEIERAAGLITTGHDGDRVNGLWDGRTKGEVSDEAMLHHAFYQLPLIDCPGAYGASTPVLDDLVDASLRAGALGASLTGAGMGGSVVAICRSEDTERVADAVCSAFPGVRSFVNCPTPAAGELGE